MATPNAQPAEDITERAPVIGWSLAHRIAFRFAFCYLVLYCMPEPGRVSVPGISLIAQPYVSLWHAITPWVAIHFFHLSARRVTYFATGSGNTTLAYVQNLLFLVVALAATAV
jgi:hypothetical protein